MPMATTVRVAVLGVLAFALAGEVQAQTLDSALAQAYRSNPTLNSQRASMRATDENVPQALSGYRPRISGTGDARQRVADHQDLDQQRRLADRRKPTGTPSTRAATA